MTARLKVPIHVDIEVKQECSIPLKELESFLTTKLAENYQVFQRGQLKIPAEVVQHVDCISIKDLPQDTSVSFWQAELCLHAYRLSDQDPESDFLEGEEEQQCAAEQWELPNRLLHGYWDSIVIEESIKQMLLSYCSSSIQFSDAGIDSDIISWNRMILIHGPPGTGKTTICKALAQKAFIRNSNKFSSGVLLEVNSHSLFSKWFSESGKLVMKLFTHINDIAEDEECLVVVLIDEVESISSSRTSSSRSNEPGDAVRVVNAVLTSLDALKRRPNVLVLSTSNMVQSLDPAFLDRIDLKLYLGPPPLLARLRIIVSFLRELTRKGLISPPETISDEINPEVVAIVESLVRSAQSLSALLSSMCGSEGALSVLGLITTQQPQQEEEHQQEAPIVSLTVPQYLYLAALASEGWSGRGLRKLPIKAHAHFIQRRVSTLTEFLVALLSTLRLEGRAVVAIHPPQAIADGLSQSGNDFL